MSRSYRPNGPTALRLRLRLTTHFCWRRLSWDRTPLGPVGGAEATPRRSPGVELQVNMPRQCSVARSPRIKCADGMQPTRPGVGVPDNSSVYERVRCRLSQRFDPIHCY